MRSWSDCDGCQHAQPRIRERLRRGHVHQAGFRQQPGNTLVSCCGDYAVLAAVQEFLPELGLPPERVVFLTGIGCAGRFAYYMNTYGVHGIHGRAPALATGLAVSRPDLSVWALGGDGDMLSIGGNHLIHALRRNMPIKILVLNNQVYGLTKGQTSQTSEFGKVTKSTPFGSEDQPFNPPALALG